MPGLLSLAFTLHAQTSAGADDLGQARPNGADLSLSPHWHVYRFERDGLRFIQVND